MNKLQLTAIALSIAALSLLAATPEAGNGQISLGGERSSAKVAPANASNLLWLSPAGNGTTDVAEWGQNPTYVDTGAWQITISGESISSVSWCETPTSFVVTIFGTVPVGNSEPVPALTY